MMCICCDKKISLLYPEDIPLGKSEEDLVFELKKVQVDGTYDEEVLQNASSYMWRDGIIDKISAGYGSGHDGDEFLIAICDDCVRSKTLTGNIAYISNYMGDMPYEDYAKARIAWRRYNNINDILDD